MNSLFQTKKPNLLIGIYFGGILSHNIFTIYWNGIEKLNDYKENKNKFGSDMEAVINGVQKNWFDNLLLSLFWPIRMPLKIMPMLILKLNSNDIEIIENETKEINDDKKENINDININENIIQKENKLITNTKDTNFDFSDSRHLGFDFSAINVK
jgi:hypothetical protein